MGRERTLLRRVAALPLWPLVAVSLLLGDVLWPALRPLVDAMARLHLAQRLRAWLTGLRAYPALLLLAVPFLILEPFKLLGLYWTATGHLLLGTASLIGAHGASLLSVERLFAVLKPKLLTIPWFAAVWARVEAIRDTLVGWVRSTRAWHRLHEGFRHIGARLRQLAGGLAGRRQRAQRPQ